MNMNKLVHREDTDDEQNEQKICEMARKRGMKVRAEIRRKVMIETWMWEKEQSHRLFNFHEGYKIYDPKKKERVSPKRKRGKLEAEVIGCHIISKDG